MLCVLATAAGFGISSSRTARRAVGGYTMIGAFGGFIVAMVTVFSDGMVAHHGADFYALLEGLFLGALSAMFEMRFPGISAPTGRAHVRHLLLLCCSHTDPGCRFRLTAEVGHRCVAVTGGIALVYFLRYDPGLFHVQVPGDSAQRADRDPVQPRRRDHCVA